MKITEVSKVASGPNPHHVDARKVHESPHAMAVVITLKPGESLKKHITPVDVFFYVLEGTGIVEIGEERQSVGKDAVLREIGNDPRFCMRMLAGLSRRLHGLVNDVQAYSLHSGVERVIGYLVRDLPEEVRDGDNVAACVVLPVSKASIASRLSMTPEYFSKVLHELEAKGLIEIDKREIRIPEPQRLTRYPLR